MISCNSRIRHPVVGLSLSRETNELPSSRSLAKFPPDAQATSDALVEADQTAATPVDGDMAAKIGDGTSSLDEVKVSRERAGQAVEVGQQVPEELAEGWAKRGLPARLCDEDRRSKGPFIASVVVGEAFEHVAPLSGRRCLDATPPDRVRVGCHRCRHNHGRCAGPHLRRDRQSSGWAAHVQGGGRVRWALIVSYGLPNYAIRIRPYDGASLATLEVWPARTTAMTMSGLATFSGWLLRSDERVRTLGLARSRLRTVLG